MQRFQPKSVIRVQGNFVLLPCRLAATFAEGVAGYAETKVADKMPTAGRKGLENRRKTTKPQVGGLMTDLGSISYSGGRTVTGET